MSEFFPSAVSKTATGIDNPVHAGAHSRLAAAGGHRVRGIRVTVAHSWTFIPRRARRVSVAGEIIVRADHRGADRLLRPRYLLARGAACHGNRGPAAGRAPGMRGAPTGYADRVVFIFGPHPRPSDRGRPQIQEPFSWGSWRPSAWCSTSESGSWKATGPSSRFTFRFLVPASPPACRRSAWVGIGVSAVVAFVGCIWVVERPGPRRDPGSCAQGALKSPDDTAGAFRPHLFTSASLGGAGLVCPSPLAIGESCLFLYPHRNETTALRPAAARAESSSHQTAALRD